MKRGMDQGYFLLKALRKVRGEFSLTCREFSHSLSAGWATTLRGNDLTGRRPFDAPDIGLGHCGGWQAVLERHAECL